ncbi:hypothetical protein NDU88_006305 [Pleurodeles waltl]|uniref:Uncharacterized protein n=1 Tax=Pleurodeles waltl TaxID=8319 RepID=A0AAV7SPA4_PLEWA|nr:hypothetical protein NDU88_006305 [Pleurodeles waltl]
MLCLCRCGPVRAAASFLLSTRAKGPAGELPPGPLRGSSQEAERGKERRAGAERRILTTPFCRHVRRLNQSDASARLRSRADPGLPAGRNAPHPPVSDRPNEDMLEECVRSQ